MNGELGLKRGTVSLMEHDDKWSEMAKKTINELNLILKDVAADIQHIGSTSIRGIHAKPIIDIVIGVRNLDDIMTKVEELKEHNIIYRGDDIENQKLFVKGDFQKDTRTYHIHVVSYAQDEWNNYINFRDYLNKNPDKALEYDRLKIKLAEEFSNDRIAYTDGKSDLVNRLIKEANSQFKNLAFDMKDYKEDGKIFRRIAVRGIIKKDNKYLIVHSNRGDYKFPGGGMEKGETLEETLIREVKEETGYRVIPNTAIPVAKLCEKRKGKNEEIFEMHSYYFLCEAEDIPGESNLTEHEIQEEYEVKWITVEEALEKNKQISGYQKLPWIIRENTVMEYYLESLK